MQSTTGDEELNNSSAHDFAILDQNALAFWDAMKLHTQEQDVSTTESGRLGLEPDNLKADDVIFYFFGATVPFILRPLDSLWLLVGCYLYDFT